MVYTSRPDHYLDPPNWNQPQHRSQLVQQGSQGGGGSARIVAGSNGGEPQLLLPPVPPLPDGGAAAGLVRPNSMAERARLAKIPMPEHALKCPRCDSTNTKFCYFNNYSLSQPRHFCKTCRRYWTRGGALRNVPVGGGCRRNKRSKSSGSSKSSSNDAKTAPGSTPGPSSLGMSIGGAMPPGLLPTSQLPLLTSLHPFSDYSMPSLGLSYGGIQQLDPIDYPVGNSSVVGLEHWRSLQQFPCFTGLEAVAPTPSPCTGMYHYNTETVETSAAAASMIAGQIQGKATCAGLITQLASVKMEESNAQGMNLPRHYLGLPGNDHYWGGGVLVGGGGVGSSGAAAWTDLSGISSTSTGSLL